ncbi:MAG TPA: helix-turn-helix transcriptional regulator [Parafilimonas sp.]|nr:helix-turn-helix transcriptional regulator [Parafilimonas sp.]
MNLGKAIKEIRKQKGLTQSELAKAANLTQAALSQIENGKRPGIQTLKKISKALKIPESLIYANSIEKTDVPKNKQLLYDQLFPVIQNLILQISK